ncbi:MAG: Na/Pi cotransporter family protein [Clostridia bacterium]|nr:Na/Pi cotransporter family protein [Clostridia bacterium]
MALSNAVLLLGGVALFLFGMSLMGDGLKKVAGNKLELILYRLSSTPLKGILLGAGVTTVIQSSSATSVMVVGFVNSGMMRLRQAIAVIMGAVVGTSVTGWIICLSSIGGDGASSMLQLLSTESLSAMVAVAGILMRMAGKKKSTHQAADILLGFSVLMFGMKTMSSAVEGLRENEAFLNLLTNFSHPLLGILAGFLITAVLQSASASVGILQALSSTGLLEFDEVLPIILGVAVGASVPVLLSGLGSSTEGRRASISYLVLEVCRSILFAVVFYGLNSFLHFTFMKQVMNMFSIALLNTLFRLITVVLLAPFIPLLEKIACLLIPSRGDDHEDTQEMNRLEERFLAYPTLAVEQTRLTINKMAELTKKSMTLAMGLIETYDEKEFREVQSLEGIVDRYEDKIGSYLLQLTGRELTDTQNKDVSQYLRAITDLERISDHALNIAERAQEMKEKEIRFSEKGTREMVNLISAVSRIIDITFEAFLSDDVDIAYRVEPLEQVIDQICRKMREKHAARLQKGKCTIIGGYIFNDLLVDFERVSDHCSNIAIVIVELLDNALDIHEMSGTLREQHTHQYETYYEEYANLFLRKAKQEALAEGQASLLPESSV